MDVALFQSPLTGLAYNMIQWEHLPAMQPDVIINISGIISKALIEPKLELLSLPSG